VTLRLAVPNKGRLEDPSAVLLRESGLAYEKTERALSVRVRNIDIELLFVRTDDVCELVADGVADLGITGLDLLAEAALPLQVITDLGYGRCRLTVAVPQAMTLSEVADFDGLRMATSHPRTTERFFADAGVSVTTVPLRGSIEVAPKLDVADAIVDLVSSGSTLLVNGLRPVITVLESQAVLVAPPGEVTGLAAEVATMIQAVVAARSKRYVLMNAPAAAVPAIEDIIPGIDAPTVVPLAHDGLVAVHSTVDADEVWSVLPRLKQVGASGILVLPIQQLIR
jgi:ATP phosphoribosyltransferase